MLVLVLSLIHHSPTTRYLFHGRLPFTLLPCYTHHPYYLLRLLLLVLYDVSFPTLSSAFLSIQFAKTKGRETLQPTNTKVVQLISHTIADTEFPIHFYNRNSPLIIQISKNHNNPNTLEAVSSSCRRSAKPSHTAGLIPFRSTNHDTIGPGAAESPPLNSAHQPKSESPGYYRSNFQT